MKVLICDGMDRSGLEIFEKAPGIEVDVPHQLSMEEIRERLPDYQAMVVRSRTKVTAEMLANAPNLKLVGRAGTGVDNVDVPSASARGILVMNTPGANATAAAEHTLAMMLSLSRHIPQATQSMREGRWEKNKFMGTELSGMTLGIIGLGKIGSILADRALAMKMEVIGFDPHIVPEAIAILGVEAVSLEEMLSRADFISVHTPMTPDTRNILNRETIAKCKRGVRLINCARGGLIDEEALKEALESGQVAGAALDVFAKEPPTGNPLLGMPNVIFTPHLGASSIQAQENVSKAIAEQIVDYLLHGVIRNAVNFPSIRPQDFERMKPYLALAEKLGSLQGQLCRPVQRIDIEYSGTDFQELPLQPLTQTVIKGILDPIMAERVNLVNAPMVLKERQIELRTSLSSETRGYTGLITVTVKGPDMELSSAGTVLLGHEIRLVRIRNYRLEAELEGVNILIQNYDKPGTIGFIGTTLGSYNVNIANMHLARTPDRDKAIAIIRVDNEAPSEAIEALKANPNIIFVQQVIL